MSNTDQWCTPPEVNDPLQQFFGGPVECDPCSNPRSIVQAVQSYYTNGLFLPWHLRGRKRPKERTCFENWPYSQSPAWTDKMIKELALGHVLEHVRLGPVLTSTDWWRNQCTKTKRNPLILFTKRIRFIDPDHMPGDVVPKFSERMGARFESALVYYGRRPAAFAKEFAHLTMWSRWGR